MGKYAYNKWLVWHKIYPSIRKSHPDWHYKRCKAIALYIGIKIARRR